MQTPGSFLARQVCAVGGTSSACSKWVGSPVLHVTELSSSWVGVRLPSFRGKPEGWLQGAGLSAKIMWQSTLAAYISSLPLHQLDLPWEGCWTLLEVIKVEMLFPVGKTIWKYTAKHIDSFGNVTSKKGPTNYFKVSLHPSLARGNCSGNEFVKNRFLPSGTNYTSKTMMNCPKRQILPMCSI